MIVAAVLFALLFGFLYFWFYKNRLKSNTVRLPKNWAVAVVAIHFLTLIITVAAVILYSLGPYVFGGFLFTRIVIAVNVLSGTLLYLVHPKKWRLKVTKCYFKIYSLLPFFVITLALIPFVGLVVLASLTSQFLSNGKTIFEDEHVIVRWVPTGVLDDGKTDIWIKKTLLYHRAATVNYGYREIDAAEVIYYSDTAKVFLLAQEKGKLTNIDSLTINFKK